MQLKTSIWKSFGPEAEVGRTIYNIKRSIKKSLLQDIHHRIICVVLVQNEFISYNQGEGWISVQYIGKKSITTIIEPWIKCQGCFIASRRNWGPITHDQPKTLIDEYYFLKRDKNGKFILVTGKIGCVHLFCFNLQR